MNRRTFVSLAIVLIGVGLQAQNRLAGKWEGTTASGTPVVLVISVKDKDITGTFTLAGQSVHQLQTARSTATASHSRSPSRGTRCRSAAARPATSSS